MNRHIDDPMEAEFGTVAEWTAQVALDLGPEYYIPGACRGSGQPEVLDWLLEHLRPRGGEAMIDAGAGMGGPAASYAQAAGSACWSTWPPQPIWTPASSPPRSSISWPVSMAPELTWPRRASARHRTAGTSADCSQRGADRDDNYPAERDGNERPKEAGAEEPLADPGERQ